MSEKATVGRTVRYRHPSFPGLELAAVVAATPESYQAAGGKTMDAASEWNFPGFTSSADDTDLERVHLVVFTPANRDPSAAGPWTPDGALGAPCFVAANVPYSANPKAPGTWCWPERQ